ncbi:MAG: 23S rRNA accumulation protein YceD [Colwellia sp.]|nr:23S rRNA accumulation protein YceD [Colwellia sp.]
MQNLKLPITISPSRSAQRRLVCEGVFKLSDMTRLLANCEKRSEHVQVSVKFNVDERGLAVMSGTASTLVALTCQRCNELFDHKFEVEFTFSPAKNEEAAEKIPSYYDVIELNEDGEVNLRELVEEEFMLITPLIPRHDIEDCSADADSIWGELPEELEKPNPFEVLKQLK